MIPRSVLQKKETLDELNGELNCGLKYSDDISCLKENVLIDGKMIPHRIVYQPMEGCDASPDGSPGELTERRYLRFASGGAGIIWFEAVSCLPEGRANPRQLMLNDENIDKYKILLEKIRETAIKENGCAPLIIMQNTHSGRYSRPNGVAEPVIA